VPQLNPMSLSLGQALQGSKEHPVIVSIKYRDDKFFYGYSVHGNWVRPSYSLMRPLCDRYERTFQNKNKFAPSLVHKWSVWTKEGCVVLSSSENDALNEATLRKQWCGLIRSQERTFVFIAHSAHGFYCFMSDAPNPQRLPLICSRV